MATSVKTGYGVEGGIESDKENVKGTRGRANVLTGALEKLLPTEVGNTIADRRERAGTLQEGRASMETEEKLMLLQKYGSRSNS